MGDRANEALIAALKQALAEPGEHRLYRSGKLSGLFPSRSGATGDAAAQALRDGLLETARTEIKGKFTIEWVRLTPIGIEYLHAHQSPLAALRELHAALKSSRTAAPEWLEGIQQQFQTFTQQMQDEMRKSQQRLEALADRVEEALRRTGAIGPTLPNGVAATVPWASDVMLYLEQRHGAGAKDECPLPDLFAAVRRQNPSLSVIDFQDGLRRLYEHKAIRLLPLATNNGAMPEPEYVMCDGPDLLYYVSR